MAKYPGWRGSAAAREITAKDLKSRWHKYGARRKKIDGHWFDSAAEAEYYQRLKVLAVAGKIFDLRVHPVYQITMSGKRVCMVEMDFYYADDVDSSSFHVVDVKGADTAYSRLKRKLFEAQYGIRVEVIKSGDLRPRRAG